MLGLKSVLLTIFHLNGQLVLQPYTSRFSSFTKDNCGTNCPHASD